MKKFNGKKILVLMAHREDPGFLKIWDAPVTKCFVYNNKFTLQNRLKKRFGLWLNWSTLSFSKEFNDLDLNSYDIIIVEENIYPDKIIKNIRQQNTHCNLYYWLLNPIEKTFGRVRFYDAAKHWKKLLQQAKRLNFTILSFDKGDCNKYNLIFNHQVAPLFKELVKTENASNNEESIYFCGADKNRLPHLNKIYDIFTELGIKCDFNVVLDKKKQYAPEEVENISCSNYIPYLTMLKKELSHDAILELVQKGQNGITWRALEALFYHKKLITNFKLIENYDFYNPNNIFILGKDNLDKLPKFLHSPFANISPSIVEQYTFEGWLNKITKEN